MSRGGRFRRRQAVRTLAFLTFWVCQVSAGDVIGMRPIEITALEPIDVGDVLVMTDEPVEIEVGTTGHRASRSGQPAFGSLPFGPGGLGLVGEPGACLRLIGRDSKSRADGGGRIDVARILLRGPDGPGSDEIYLRLDSNGLAWVDVGVKLQLQANRPQLWRLSLVFQAEYSEECLR